MNGTISVPLITHYGYYFFCYASFDTLLVYQICFLFFLCAVINHCLPSAGFSQTSIPSTLYKTHFTSENNTWQDSSQDLMPVGWETEASHSPGAACLRQVRGGGTDTPYRWIQFKNISREAWTNFFPGFHCTPFIKVFCAAICAPPLLSDHVLNAGSCLPREPPVVSLMDRELKMEKISVLSPFTLFFFKQCCCSNPILPLQTYPIYYLILIFFVPLRSRKLLRRESYKTAMEVLNYYLGLFINPCTLLLSKLS